jgi:hypothetical protein
MIPIWVLYVALSITYALIGSACLLAAVPPIVRAVRRRRRRTRRRGYISEDLIRRVRFYDDQADPRELIR